MHRELSLSKKEEVSMIDSCMNQGLLIMENADWFGISSLIKRFRGIVGPTRAPDPQQVRGIVL